MRLQTLAGTTAGNAMQMLKCSWSGVTKEQSDEAQQGKGFVIYRDLTKKQYDGAQKGKKSH